MLSYTTSSFSCLHTVTEIAMGRNDASQTQLFHQLPLITLITNCPRHDGIHSTSLLAFWSRLIQYFLNTVDLYSSQFSEPFYWCDGHASINKLQWRLTWLAIFCPNHRHVQQILNQFSIMVLNNLSQHLTHHSLNVNL